MVKRKLKWYEKALQRLGVKIQGWTYGMVWSSRRVIKGVDGHEFSSNHYYDSDIWSTVAGEIKDRIPKGVTLYGEIVGFTPEGSPIQKRYSYGCAEKQHKFYVYRATITNEDGKVIELSWPQMKELCSCQELEMVPEIYYGLACTSDWGGNIDADTADSDTLSWQESFMKAVEADLVEGKKCKFNSFELPGEGVVIRIDKPLRDSEAFKLKSFEFTLLESEELDAGVADLETIESNESL